MPNGRSGYCGMLANGCGGGVDGDEMSEQFDASQRPPAPTATRAIRQYGRNSKHLNYREHVSLPLVKDTFAIMVICFGAMVWLSLVASWLNYGIIDYTVLFYTPVSMTIIMAVFVCGAVGWLWRMPLHLNKYYANTKPRPVKETFEYAVKSPDISIAPRREITIDGIPEYYEPVPKTVTYKNESITFSREQIKELASWYDAGDGGIRKIGNDSWRGFQELSEPISELEYQKMIRIFEGRQYFTKSGNKKIMTDFYIVELLQLPHPEQDDD